MRGMGLALDKNAKATKELAEKGMMPDEPDMQLSLIVRGQHPPGDIAGHLRDDLDLVRARRPARLRRHRQGFALQRPPVRVVQQIPFLAYCAAIAPRLRIICGLVLVPLHKPLDLAEQLATLDLMSGGKLVFGCRDRLPRCRVQGVRRAARRAWARASRNALTRSSGCGPRISSTMKGSHFELDRANCTVKPLQKPTPPIWIGANADVAIRRAARHRRLLVHQPAQHAGDDRAADGPLQARARRVGQAVPAPRCRCAARCSSRRPAPRRSASPSPISKRNTRPTAPGGRTR